MYTPDFLCVCKQNLQTAEPVLPDSLLFKELGGLHSRCFQFPGHSAIFNSNERQHMLKWLFR
ncbi:hypothetical protein J4Q44_G00297710 [Coregonus suidteri]|uniref:Uncharacterized protein n=1 Tax=Coregonus suidteri TaxID=861788 RepID=A0AAN8KX50_9TELE